MESAKWDIEAAKSLYHTPSDGFTDEHTDFVYEMFVTKQEIYERNLHLLDKVMLKHYPAVKQDSAFKLGPFRVEYNTNPKPRVSVRGNSTQMEQEAVHLDDVGANIISIKERTLRRIREQFKKELEELIEVYIVLLKMKSEIFKLAARCYELPDHFDKEKMIIQVRAEAQLNSIDKSLIHIKRLLDEMPLDTPRDESMLRRPCLILVIVAGSIVLIFLLIFSSLYFMEKTEITPPIVPDIVANFYTPSNSSSKEPKRGSFRIVDRAL